MKRVVITGLGAISPIGLDAFTTWESMKKGVNGIDFITRYSTENFKVKIAAEVKNFDPLKYFEPGEIRRTDLYTQYAVAAAFQAVEDSGIKDNINTERFGCYISSGIGGLITFYNESVKLHTEGANKVSPFFIPSMIENIAAGTVAIKLNCQGPALTTVTACASGTNSIGEAFRAIKYGFVDAIIAGGSEAVNHPLVNAGFANCMALTKRNDPQNASVPFDKRRDGFVYGEGSGAIILEEYEHAKKRNAKIYAEVVGYGHTCDAHHITAPAPGGAGAARAIKQALEEGKIDSDYIYINAHGTSTPLNDKSETAAIKTALGEERARRVLISSTKSMVGHCLGAAGALEAIASIMALKQQIAPPTINYKETDPECDLDYVPNKARKARLEYSLSNSMGFGGHNAVVAFKKV